VAADKCMCGFKKDLAAHDLLVGLEDLSPAFAAMLVAQLLVMMISGREQRNPYFPIPTTSAGSSLNTTGATRSRWRVWPALSTSLPSRR
jgi:hypothetical protein